MKPLILKIAAFILLAFALVTLFMSGSVIFDLFDIREKEGNYVLFVVVLNFLCGFLYLLSAFGLFFRKKWATRLLFTSTAILLISFAGLLWNIKTGGIYEQQTVKAMLFRIGMTILFTGISWRYISQENKNKKTEAI